MGGDAAAGRSRRWVADGKVHVKNAGTTAADVPVTGTDAGSLYGGEKSGWITVAPGAEQVLTPTQPLAIGRPADPVTQPGAGNRTTTSPGTGNGSTPATPTKPATKARAKRLTLTKLKMSPRKFAVSHKRKPRGTRLDGSRITFKVSTNSSVRLIVQRRSSGRHKRWMKTGTSPARSRRGPAICGSPGASASGCSSRPPTGWWSPPGAPARRAPRPRRSASAWSRADAR